MAVSNFALANLPAILTTIMDPALEDLVNVSSVGAGAWTIEPGEWADLARFGYGETSNNNAKTLDLAFECEVPPSKVTPDSNPIAGTDATVVPITVTVEARLTGTPASTAEIDCSAHRSTRRGDTDATIGTSGELCTTAAQNLKTAGANNWTTYTFNIDATDIEGGHKLLIALRCTNNDTGGTGGGRVEIGSVKVTGYCHGGIR